MKFHTTSNPALGTNTAPYEKYPGILGAKSPPPTLGKNEFLLRYHDNVKPVSQGLLFRKFVFLLFFLDVESVNSNKHEF